MAAYGIVMAIGAGAYGKLAEFFSFRRLYVVGLLLFAGGSLVGYFARSYPQVIIGRLIQASGASSISPLSYGIATRFTRPDNRGRVLGALSATIAFASGFGPVCGGFIEQYAGWRALFLVSGSVVFALPLVIRYIPDTERRHGNFDPLGMALFSIAVAFILLGVAVNPLWWALGLAASWEFWAHIKKSDRPFIRASLLRNTPYRRILWIAFVTFLCNTGLMYILPIAMKSSFHLPTGSIGMLMVPGAISAALLGSKIGRCCDRYGALRILVISQWLVIAGFVVLGVLVRFLPWIDAIILILLMVGFNGMLTASGKLVSQPLAEPEIGMGMGIFTLAYLLGGAFGPAIVGRILDFKAAPGAIFYGLASIGLLSFLISLTAMNTKRLSTVPMVERFFKEDT